jgi:hypothetical protein
MRTKRRRRKRRNPNPRRRRRTAMKTKTQTDLIKLIKCITINSILLTLYWSQVFKQDFVLRKHLLIIS